MTSITPLCFPPDIVCCERLFFFLLNSNFTFLILHLFVSAVTIFCYLVFQTIIICYALQSSFMHCYFHAIYCLLRYRAPILLSQRYLSSSLCMTSCILTAVLFKSVFIVCHMVAIHMRLDYNTPTLLYRYLCVSNLFIYTHTHTCYWTESRNTKTIEGFVI